MYCKTVVPGSPLTNLYKTIIFDHLCQWVCRFLIILIRTFINNYYSDFRWSRSIRLMACAIYITELWPWMGCWITTSVLGSFHKLHSWNCLLNQCKSPYLQTWAWYYHLKFDQGFWCKYYFLALAVLFCIANVFIV